MEEDDNTAPPAGEAPTAEEEVAVHPELAARIADALPADVSSQMVADVLASAGLTVVTQESQRARFRVMEGAAPGSFVLSCPPDVKLVLDGDEPESMTAQLRFDPPDAVQRMAHMRDALTAELVRLGFEAAALPA